MRIFVKNFVLTSIICAVTCCNCYAINVPQSAKPLPSETYARRLTICGAHKESIFYNIPLNPSKTRNAHFKEVLSIIGIRNGKCSIQSKIILKDAEAVISKTECALTTQQQKTLAEKIKNANLNSKRKDEFINYYNYLTTKSPNTCEIKDYLED